MKDAAARNAAARIFVVVAAAALMLLARASKRSRRHPTCSRARAWPPTVSRPIAGKRTARFLGKVDADTARCRGGERAVDARASPYVDWPGYWAAAGADSLGGDANGGAPGAAERARHRRRARRSRISADRAHPLQPVRQQRHLSSTYVEGRDGVAGPALKVWDAMRLPPSHPAYGAVGGAGEQVCGGELIRFRNADRHLQRHPQSADGIDRASCSRATSNSMRRSPSSAATSSHATGTAIGCAAESRSAGHQPRAFHARAVAAGRLQRRARVAGRRDDRATATTRRRRSSTCSAAFWIQFMTHDWFSHLEEGHNADGT